MAKPGMIAFWDTSALVPLCVFQTTTKAARQAARSFPRQVVWWLTPLEAISSIQRLLRDGYVSSTDAADVMNRFETLRSRWTEVLPSEEIRSSAERLLRVHRLRAADAMQLAAALVWVRNEPRGRMFICADAHLLDAAQREGFTTLRVRS